MENILSFKPLQYRPDAVGARPSKSRFVKRISAFLAVLLVVSLPYLRLTNAYFLGYDDFKEVHRAAFEDTRQPARIFTTGHFGEAKYRPLNRAFNFISYRLGHGASVAFRARNLFFHLLNCAILFGIGMLLFDSIFISSLGAVLFGLNPLAHQPVAGAVMTNTAAASMALIAVFLGLCSCRESKHELRWLVLAITVAWIGVLLYEVDVAVLGIIFLYFALDSSFLHRLRARKLWVCTFLLLSALVIASMIGMRAMVLTGVQQPIASLAAIAKNVAMYVLALLLPIDPLLANQWLGTPLVSEIPLDGFIKIIGACGVCLVAFVLFAYRRSIRRYASALCILPCTFLLGAACLSILPLLVFNDHPSETYLYLPVAFAMLLLARILSQLRLSHPAVSCVMIALLLASFGCATWGRSRRVIRSAAIAQRILSELPTDKWRQGDWRIRLANAPGYILPHRYGLYTYRGLDTIGTGEEIGAIQKALQLQTGNEHGVVVDVLSAQQMSQICSPATAIKEPCFWVYPNGRVEQFLGVSTAE
jgi:hypothetical protein